MIAFNLLSLIKHDTIYYTALILGGMASAILSDLIVTIRTPHFGKIFFDNRFIGFWRLFLYSILLLGLLTILFEWLSPYFDAFLNANLTYYFGISAFIIGLFFCWFVYAFDYDVKTQWKWVFPLVCFLITILNIVILNTH